MKKEQTLISRGYTVTECGKFLNPKGVEIGYVSRGYVTSNIRRNKKKQEETRRNI